VTRLTAIDPRNIIGPSGDESEHSAPSTPPTSSAPPSSYSLRIRNAGQSALRYDTKYHPMDDAVRPSQAAKRRALHEDVQISSDESDNMSSMRAESSDESDEEEPKKDVKKKPQLVTKGKKRTRAQVELWEPTRRSSRQTAGMKVLYDMNVHPQDEDLIVLSSNDDEAEAGHIAKRKKSSHSKAIVIKSGSVDSDEDVMSSVEDSDSGMNLSPAGAPGTDYSDSALR
jgi:hypothetical protein